jgi:hypothetical protein
VVVQLSALQIEIIGYSDNGEVRILTGSIAVKNARAGPQTRLLNWPASPKAVAAETHPDSILQVFAMGISIRVAAAFTRWPLLAN